MEWQPIETAPKDGTDILVVCAGFVPVVVRWKTNKWADAANYFSMSADWKATHWMPLPTPPVSGGTE